MAEQLVLNKLMQFMVSKGIDPLTSAFEYQREEIHECIGQMWHGEFRALI